MLRLADHETSRPLPSGLTKVIVFFFVKKIYFLAFSGKYKLFFPLLIPGEGHHILVRAGDSRPPHGLIFVGVRKQISLLEVKFFGYFLCFFSGKLHVVAWPLCGLGLFPLGRRGEDAASFLFPPFER